MYVKYGDYQHADNEASVIFTAQALRSPWRGYRYAMRYVMEIMGELSCNHPTKTLSQQTEDLIAGYAQDGKTLGVYNSNGTPTKHFLDSTRADLIDGPNIEMRRWPKSDEGEFASHRTYHIVATAEYYAPDDRDFWPGMVKYQERMLYKGQPPVQVGAVTIGRRVFLYDIGGNEHQQVVASNYSLILIQSGEALGYAGWVFPLDPVEPFRLHPDLTEKEYVGPTFGSNVYSGGSAKIYESRWQYVMNIPFATYGNYSPVSR
jgi:hypothetical protein